MFHAAVACAGLLAVVPFPEDASASAQDQKTYDALRLKAGQDAPAQVKLALWCEAHGLESKRLEHLAQAVLADPANATARGLLGLIFSGGRWESPDQVGERLRADEARGARLAEYNRRRDKLEEKERELKDFVHDAGLDGPPGTISARDRARMTVLARQRARMVRELALGHANLGTWCHENGLEPEAIAHFTTAVHLDPTREASWRHLGYVKHNGRWTSPEQAAAQEKDEREQRQADRHWEPLLRKWKGWLAGSASQRDQAEAGLAAVIDPRAVPALLKVFRTRSEPDQARLVQALGRIDDPRSSRALAELAAETKFDSVRVAAIEVLRKRPRRDYAGALVERIRDKVDYSVQPVEGPGSRGSLVLDTPRVRMVLTYDAPSAFRFGRAFRGYAGYDANGLPMVVEGIELEQMARDRNPMRVAARMQAIEARTLSMIADANIKAQAVQQRMAADINQVEAANEQAAEDNAQVIPVLRAAADVPEDVKDTEESWNVWWHDTLGYSYQSPSKVTIVQDASPSQLPAPLITTCFVAGTPVRTPDGPRPIESIRVGDQVLAQDESTGALAFQPVVFVHHNPPGKTLRVSLHGGGSVVGSVYHRFWRANRGWAMARELKPGDVLRTLGGLAKVEAVEPDATQPLYNLDVANMRTFFAGARDLLVHDNTLPDHRLRPFDALPDVGAGADAPGGGSLASPRDAHAEPRRSRLAD